MQPQAYPANRGPGHCASCAPARDSTDMDIVAEAPRSTSTTLPLWSPVIARWSVIHPTDLIARTESVLAHDVLPGKSCKGKFLIGDVHRVVRGDNLEVVLDGEKAGQLWTDRATGDGGDIFALIGGHFGIDVLPTFFPVLEQSSDLIGQRSDRCTQNHRPLVDDLGPATPIGTTWTPVGT